MFVGLVDTRKPEPEPEEEREPLLERVPELRPWRWYVLTIVRSSGRATARPG